MGFLSLPKAEGLDLDSPETAAAHRAIIMAKPFLRRFYAEMYEVFRGEAANRTSLPGTILEIGSGAGFLKDVLPEAITSDVFPGPGVDKVCSADALPFSPGSLKAVFLLNTLHHLPKPEAFFAEARRCLVPGGRVVMIEPARTVFSRLLYKNFHHEPFDDAASGWSPAPGGRLSGSNQAIPWLVFERDRARFEREFPELKIVSLERHSVLCYPLSGGLSMKALVPAASYPLFSLLDRVLSALGPGLFPIFETIVLEKAAPKG